MKRIETEEEDRKKRLLSDVEVEQLREGLHGKMTHKKADLEKGLKQIERDLKQLYSEH